MPIESSIPPAPGSRGAAGIRLRRSVDDRVVVGVCAGIAGAFGVSPLLVRVIALAAAIAIPPIALIVYAGLAIAAPRDDGRALLGGHPPDRRETLLGWALVVVGLIAVGTSVEAASMFGGPGWLVLLAAGLVLLIVHNQRRDAPRSPQSLGGADTEATVTAPVTATGRVVDLPYPGPPRAAATSATAPTMPLAAVPRSAPTAPVPGPRERSVALYGFAAIVAAATVAIILEALGAFDVSGRGLAVAFGAGALALTVGAVALAKRRGAGTLVALAVVLAFGSLGAAAVGDHLENGVGDRNEYLVAPADLAREYEFGVGSFTLDLSDGAIPPGVSTLRAKLGIGELVVRVPRGVQVISVGDTSVGGTRFVNDLAGPEPKRTLRIVADVDHGSAEVGVLAP